MAMSVEVVCQAENKVVGVVDTTGDLDAHTIRTGIRDRDQTRVNLTDIQDGAQMVCSACQEPLFFRAQDGALTAAMPGSCRAVG